MAVTSIIHPINTVNGKILSNPSDPKVLAIIQNIPIGAIFMMAPISFIIRWFNSSKRL